MSIISSASGNSLLRGYNYYEDKKVKLFLKLSEDEYEGFVDGSRAEPYHVKINISHTRQSKCNCPHAEGKNIICKHMVALFFTAFPKEADKYIKEVEEHEREEEKREEEHYKKIKKYVFSLNKEQLRQELLNYIIQSEEDKHYW